MDLPDSDNGTQNAITLNMPKTPEFPAVQAVQTDDDISEFRSLLMKVPDRYRSNVQWNTLRDCDIALGMVACQYEETRSEAASRVRRHLAAGGADLLRLQLDPVKLPE